MMLIAIIYLACVAVVLVELVMAPLIDEVDLPGTLPSDADGRDASPRHANDEPPEERPGPAGPGTAARQPSASPCVRSAKLRR